MKKRITKSQLGKLVEAQVRQLLGEDKKSEIEQSWDEYDKSSNKNINKAAQFSPTLAPHYNHNVEDGREEVEAYVGGLEEKILKQVKKALSEEVNYDYDGKWEEYVRNEVHNLYELEEKVPYSYRSVIHSAMTELETILDAQKRNREFDNWNN